MLLLLISSLSFVCNHQDKSFKVDHYVIVNLVVKLK